MLRYFFKLLIFIAPSLVSASELYGSVTISSLVSVYDGDTFKVDITHYPPLIGQHISIRINGVDTPEMRGKCEQEKVLARKAKQYTEMALRNAKTIELRNIQRGKYFRVVADVYADGQSLGEGLVRDGLAVVYDGSKKVKDWCK